jgi:tetratricopeptide (TPR) repeat protein
VTGESGRALGEARLLLVQDRLAEAAALVEGILEADPADEGALLLLAEIRMASAREEDALRLYRRAVDLHPGSAEARNGLARGLHALHEDDLALAGRRGGALARERCRPRAVGGHHRRGAGGGREGTLLTGLAGQRLARDRVFAEAGAGAF